MIYFKGVMNKDGWIEPGLAVVEVNEEKMEEIKEWLAEKVKSERSEAEALRISLKG
jgi:hypothetical protein